MQSIDSIETYPHETKNVLVIKIREIGHNNIIKRYKK